MLSSCYSVDELGRIRDLGNPETVDYATSHQVCKTFGSRIARITNDVIGSISPTVRIGDIVKAVRRYDDVVLVEPVVGFTCSVAIGRI